ncbi:hypothetical protein EJ73_01816 [Hoylesella shahii DSM 15611 = JCM 12083]|uniref:Uncharacterized protein n=1 Tax=Hoylesella shahii DSM 15611 = JCM 12083 TaxID=1122991 RepID=A0A318HSN9_9BACT|nr:hypothetical protein EJ73_01816 [Hoylesella shahii DSM 15611 = JCM 12083]
MHGHRAVVRLLVDAWGVLLLVVCAFVCSPQRLVCLFFSKLSSVAMPSLMMPFVKVFGNSLIITNTLNINRNARNKTQ